MNTERVRAGDLNYHWYTLDEYDRGIAAAIPGHRALHMRLQHVLQEYFDASQPLRVRDLGTGTGITAHMVKNTLPKAELEVVDFSTTMLDHARKKLGTEGVTYVLENYAEGSMPDRYDLITSVIGFHHQTDEEKQKLLRDIAGALKEDGLFALGDLMTFRDATEAAVANAKHYHHLVEHADDEKMLGEWAHHHLFLNRLSTVEDLKQWMSEAGLESVEAFRECNTVLLIAGKQGDVRSRIQDALHSSGLQ
jgi:tRNA (cmo5U34)-methyltransferase